VQISANLAALAVATTSVLTNPNADFLAALDSHRITYTSPQQAITNAHAVCALLGSGASPAGVVRRVMSKTKMDGYHAGFFVGVSIAAYCPAEA
jgi:hypothetical protein